MASFKTGDNQWEDFITYVSKFDVDEVIHRFSIILNVGGDTDKPNTVDNYRRTLTKLGYLTTQTPYKVLKRIPRHLTYTKTKMLAYPNIKK